MAFPDELADWTDWDCAAYSLRCALGLFSEGGYPDNKHVFWTNNPLGKGLHEALLTLAEAGVLEQRDEPDVQFRWSSATGK